MRTLTTAYAVADGDAAVMTLTPSVLSILYSTTRSRGLAAVDGLRARLYDEELLGQSIHGPFHVHGAPMALEVAVVFLDGGHTARDLQRLLIADAEAVALCALDREW
jgi:hypothetical protein